VPPDPLYENRPLCVDLDGTLVCTDTLWESVMVLLAGNPFQVPLVLLWLLRGRARLKQSLASRVSLDPAKLPYNQALLAYLQAQYALGRRLILVTAADREIAGRIAEHVSLFSEVLASDGVCNLKGNQKRAVLDERFGKQGYDYAGNSASDIVVWQGCKHAILVNASRAVSRRAAAVSSIEQEFRRERFPWQAVVSAIRPHQWIKNVLVFLPVITAHQIFNSTQIFRAFLAMTAFSLCASSVYVLNDLLDLSSDRAHPRKRHRPFATGRLSIPLGLALIPLLLACSVEVSLWLPSIFRLVLAIYYICTLAYSLSLKRRLLLDIFLLAGLYTLRVLAGSAATFIEPSAWLLAFCLFLFLSLALVKRFTELYDLKSRGAMTASGRGYSIIDIDAVGSLGANAGFMCVLVLALYINSPQVIPLYRFPWMLWFLCPLLLYWISRVWVLAYRGSIHDDPVLFAMRDRPSYIVGAFCGLILVLASRGLPYWLP
jgi:4-hydroxybenzoate polyprenyltransferase